MALDLDLDGQGNFVLSNTDGKVFATFPIDGIWDLVQEDPNWVVLLEEYAKCVSFDRCVTTKETLYKLLREFISQDGAQEELL